MQGDLQLMSSYNTRHSQHYNYNLNKQHIRYKAILWAASYPKMQLFQILLLGQGGGLHPGQRGGGCLATLVRRAMKFAPRRASAAQMPSWRRTDMKRTWVTMAREFSGS